MKTFQITDKYSISQFDEKNWVIRRKQVVNVEKRKKMPLEGTEVANTAIHGYYSNLENAKKEMAELLGKTSNNFSELERWINKIKEI